MSTSTEIDRVIKGFYCSVCVVLITYDGKLSIAFLCGMKMSVYEYITELIEDILPGSAFIKADQLDPWIKDQIKITLLPTISHLQLPNFVSCGRACPSHMTQNLVTVGAQFWRAEGFLVDPWSMDYADPVW